MMLCGNCGLKSLCEKTNLSNLHKFYNSEKYYQFWGELNPENIRNIEHIKRLTFQKALKKVTKYKKGGKLLEIGCATGILLAESQKNGFEVYGVECYSKFAKIAKTKVGSHVTCGMFENIQYPKSYFDIVVMYDSLEHLKDPFAVISKINRILKAHGLLVIATPNTQSLSAKLMGKYWTHYKKEHLFYFSPKSLKFLLLKYHFRPLSIENERKALNLSYIYHQLQTFSTFGLTRFVSLLYQITPKRLRCKHLFLSSGEMLTIAEKL